MSLRARFWHSLDVFLPRAGIGSPEDRRRARLGIGMSLALAPVLAIMSITQLAWGNPEGGMGCAAIGLVLAIAPFVYRRWGRFGLIVHAVLGFAWLALSYIAISSRGAGINAATVGLAELPLFALLLTGVRGGAAWLIIVFSTELGLAWLGHTGRLVERIPAPERLFVEYSALVLITLSLFAVGVMYEVRRRQGLSEVADQDKALREAERRQVQAETDARLAHAERLASIGRVTAAVAHEINNPLSYLAMNLRFIRDELGTGRDDQGEMARALADAIDGVSRIADLVARLRGYARTDTDSGERDATRLSVALDQAIQLAEPHTRGRAHVNCELEDLPPARGAESSLVQAFFNLIVNAAQALPEGRVADNRITIRALRRDQWLAVEICDNGRGIPSDVLPRLGEPFFTTRPIGEGTGLGVAVSKSTIHAAGGKLEFESEPGRTVARVLLPVADTRQSEPLPPAAPVPTIPVTGHGATDISGLRILIVDDDERVARSLRRALSAHEITAVSSGAGALEVLSRRTDFDLILCDLMMPGMTGMDLYRMLAESHPALTGRIIFITGGAFTVGAREFCDRHAARVLHKPVSIEALTRVLVEVARGCLPAAT